MAAIHKVKISLEQFSLLRKGKKRALLRKGDRKYRIGDYLILHEWNGYSIDRIMPVKISHVESLSEKIDCEGDWVILSFASLGVDDYKIMAYEAIERLGDAL